ncbi:MAG: class I SAM-dependent methyltransferase [Chitinophagaceae bacterium]|nr:class I SAM-dependent methyltransferase [Chitinophagaceae bacterium]
MKDMLGQAIADYYHKTSAGSLWVHNKYGPKEKMPVEIYFRNADDMPELEWIALQRCRGRILDIGAGAGSHALFLQKTGMNVTALDISPLNAKVMKERGIRDILCQDFFTLKAHKKYDCLLLLMNGIGLAGTLDGLHTFFQKTRRLLRPGGRLIFDSSDIAYLYRGKPPGEGPYYGEVRYRYEYRRMHGEWFNWLFIDRRTLTRIAGKEGWNVKLLYKDPFAQYLVECTMT